MGMNRFYIRIMLYTIVIVLIVDAVQKYSFSASIYPSLGKAGFFSSIFILTLFYLMEYLLTRIGVIEKYNKKKFRIIVYSLGLAMGYYVVRLVFVDKSFFSFSNTYFDFLAFRLILVIFTFILSCVTNVVILNYKK